MKNAIAKWRADGCPSDGVRIKVPPPASVNVQVPNVLATNQNRDQRLETAGCMHNGALAKCIVIPIPLGADFPALGKNRRQSIKLRSPQRATFGGAPDCPEGCGAAQSTEGQTLRFDWHPVTLSFALTYNKLQGQTLHKIILNLNKTPRALKGLTFNHFYVGLSRAKTKMGIRFMPFYSNRGKHDHLFTKKHCSDLVRYLQGFAPPTWVYHPPTHGYEQSKKQPRTPRQHKRRQQLQPTTAGASKKRQRAPPHK